MLLANRPVLVLNKNWQPISVSPLHRALAKLTTEYKNGLPKAKIIDPNDFSLWTWDDWSKLKAEDEKNSIRGVHQSFRIPEIILVEYDKCPHHKVKYSRRMLYKRDGNICQYCGKQFDPIDLNIDHCVPRSQGGLTTWENTVVSCFKCNSHKRNRTPAQAGMRLIRQPIKPKFNFFKTERRFIPRSWQHFLDFAYWNVELENDNK